MTIAVEIGEYEDHEMAAKAKELLIMLPIILHGVIPSFSSLETFLYGCFDRILLKAAICLLNSTEKGWSTSCPHRWFWNSEPLLARLGDKRSGTRLSDLLFCVALSSGWVPDGIWTGPLLTSFNSLSSNVTRVCVKDSDNYTILIEKTSKSPLLRWLQQIGYP